MREVPTPYKSFFSFPFLNSHFKQADTTDLTVRNIPNDVHYFCASAVESADVVIEYYIIAKARYIRDGIVFQRSLCVM